MTGPQPPLIDTHQHLLFRDRFGYGWSDTLPPLAGRSFLPADYDRLTEGLGVARAIFMEAGADEADHRGEARHVRRTMAGTSTAGIIASIRPETDAGFDAWLEECVEMGVVGFRRLLHVVGDEVSQGETFRRNVRRIGAAGKVFDIVMLARQLPLAAALADACPETQFVLDHCGNPDLANDAFAPWAAGMAALAERPNVVVKLSGLTVNCGPGQHHETVIGPCIDHMVGLFGADRILWGSDWPVVDLSVGLREWIAISRRILGRLSGDEAAAIAHRTATRIYGVPLPREAPAA